MTPDGGGIRADAEWPPALAKGAGELAPAILSPEDLEFCDRARDLLTVARAEAARWDDAARTRFRTARRQGHREGFDAGLAEVMGAAARAADGVEAARRECEAAVQTLALSALERFFRDAPFPELMRCSIAAAMAELRVAGTPSITAHPADGPALEEEFARHDLPIRVEPAPELPRGEVELRLEHGHVAISLDRHLETLRRVLADRG